MNDRFDLAIWLESDELSHTDQHDDSGDSRASDTSGIQVHLNFWKLPKYNAFDIGINFPTFRECPAYTLLYQFFPKDTGKSKVK